MTALGTMFGLFRTGEHKSLGVVVTRTMLALSVGVPICYALFGVAPDGQAARSVLAYAALFTLAAVIIVRPTAAGCGRHRCRPTAHADRWHGA